MAMPATVQRAPDARTAPWGAALRMVIGRFKPTSTLPPESAGPGGPGGTQSRPARLPAEALAARGGSTSQPSNPRRGRRLGLGATLRLALSLRHYEPAILIAAAWRSTPNTPFSSMRTLPR